jgi:hypothetical protein
MKDVSSKFSAFILKDCIPEKKWLLMIKVELLTLEMRPDVQEK